MCNYTIRSVAHKVTLILGMAFSTYSKCNHTDVSLREGIIHTCSKIEAGGTPICVPHKLVFPVPGWDYSMLVIVQTGVIE